MLEIVLIVLLCINFDGSKKKAINIIGIIGFTLTLILAIFWNKLLFLDVVLYAALLTIGNFQGKNKKPLPKDHKEPLEAGSEEASNNC